MHISICLKHLVCVNPSPGIVTLHRYLIECTVKSRFSTFHDGNATKERADVWSRCRTCVNVVVLQTLLFACLPAYLPTLLFLSRQSEADRLVCLLAVDRSKANKGKRPQGTTQSTLEERLDYSLKPRSIKGRGNRQRRRIGAFKVPP